MTAIAKHLGRDGWVLRSGGAPGADTAFERGALEIGSPAEIYLPWPRFNDHPSHLTTVCKHAIEIAEVFHPTLKNLSRASRLLHGRNTYQVLGTKLDAPVDMIICWTEDAKGGGGTGQAIRIATHLGIRIEDLGDPGIERYWRDVASSTEDPVFDWHTP